MLEMIFLLVFFFNFYWKMENLIILMILLMNLMIFNLSLKINYSNDFMSFFIMMMTFMIMFLTNIFIKKSKTMLLVMMSMMKIFLSYNFIEMFVFFEFSMYPMFFFIMKNGNYFGRVKASFFMFFYTMILSMPFLIYIMEFKKYTNYWYLIIYDFYLSNLMFLMILLAMMVKLPLFMVHLWLPKAHVESSVMGSMVLAAILLKISVYMILRMIKMFFNNNFFIFIYWFSLWGCLLVSINCLNSNDYKILIAYSSIAHMGLILTSLLMNSKIYLYSMIMISLAHAFISSNMFFSFNIYYDFCKNKSILMSKGIFYKNMMMIYLIFMIFISNFSVPPFLSFFSEILNLFLILMMEPTSYIVNMMLMYFFSLYNMHFFFNISFGKSKNFFFINSKNLMMIIIQLFMSLLYFLFIMNY